MSAPSFSKETPDKIGNGINVSGKNTLIKTESNGFRVAIADEPINAKIDGKRTFCIRVDNAGMYLNIEIGFTPLEKFDANTNEACFGHWRFTGCGISLGNGYLWYAVDKHHNIIDKAISQIAKEIIAVLTISNNGAKKEIGFLVDGKESKSSDVSEHLEGDFLFPAIVLWEKNQQITTIPIDQMTKRTPEIENLTKEYQQHPKNHIYIDEVKHARNKLLKQNEEMMSDFFKQFEQQAEVSDVVEAETKKENAKEKKVKQVATKKTKKETKPNTTKVTKKKEETKNSKKEKKTKAKK
jgi:hypothetical protein